MILALLAAIAFWVGMAMLAGSLGLIAFALACVAYDRWRDRDQSGRTLTADLDRLWGVEPVFIAGDDRFPLLHLDAAMGRTLADIQSLDEVW